MHLELKLLYERIVADDELNAVLLTGAGSTSAWAPTSTT